MSRSIFVSVINFKVVDNTLYINILLYKLICIVLFRPLFHAGQSFSRNAEITRRRIARAEEPIEESRKRECNVIRIVHCRMTRLYIYRQMVERGAMEEDGFEVGRRVYRRHSPSLPFVSSRPCVAQQSRGDEKTLIQACFVISPRPRCSYI